MAGSVPSLRPFARFVAGLYALCALRAPRRSRVPGSRPPWAICASHRFVCRGSSCIGCVPGPRHSLVGWSVCVLRPRLSWPGFRLCVSVPAFPLGLGGGVPCPRHSWLGLVACRFAGCGSARPSCCCVCPACCSPSPAFPLFAAPGGGCCLAPCLVPRLLPAACLSSVPCGPALVRCASSGRGGHCAPAGFPVNVVPSPTGFSDPTVFLRGCPGHVADTGQQHPVMA